MVEYLNIKSTTKKSWQTYSLIEIAFSLASDAHEQIVIFLSMLNTCCHILLLLVEKIKNIIGVKHHYIAVVMLL